MEYPTLNVKQKLRQMTDAFAGYDHRLMIGDSEFYDMKNMTSDYYPVLSPRGGRGLYKNSGKATGLIAKDKLCYVDGTEFVVGDDRIEMGLSTDADMCPKDLISMGAYVIIMPDKKYINTIKNGTEYEHGSIETRYTNADLPNTPDFGDRALAFMLCDINGNNFENAEPSATAPVNPTDGKYWIDTSTVPNTLKKYAASSAMWVSIPTTYVKIGGAGLGEKFNQYDGVEISGINVPGLESLNGYHAIWACDDTHIIITGIMNRAHYSQTLAEGAVTIERKMPKMDFLTECNNRLWGCRYGTNNEGEVVNEIYACKQGDFKNWNCFMNLSTDSYAASCGSDGPFTGAITHLGYPLFFKENCVHKVYGDYPANFQIQHTTCRGVQKGSHGSLSIVNDMLYYKAGNAVCAYDGSLPVEVSSALGDVRYSDAVAEGNGNKYYIDMKSDDGVYHLFVYDTAKGMWHKEDNIQVDSLCSFRNELYAIDHETKRIITMLGEGDKYEGNLSWMLESGLIGVNLPDMKYISKLLIRMSLNVGSSVEISIQYDSIDDWERVCQMTVTNLRSFAVPIRLRRCDHFRLRIEGKGMGKI